MNAKPALRIVLGILILTLLTGLLIHAARHKPAPAAARAETPPIPASPAPTTQKTEPTTRQAILAAEIKPPVLSASSALSQGKAKLDAGDLLAGRKILNDTLNAGNLSAADASAIKALISTANQTLIFSPRQFPKDPYCGTFTVPSGGVLAKIAKRYSVTGELLARVNGLSDPTKLRAAQTIKVINGPFHAVVTKGAFTLDLYLGGVAGESSAMFVTSFPVGLGKDGSTPAGSWIVEPGRKLTNPTYYSPRGQGVIAAGDAANPLGKFWIGLGGTDNATTDKTSYGIHGTIDPDSIGKEASMGCIRMHNEDVTLVYEMLVEGKSTVLVKN